MHDPAAPEGRPLTGLVAHPSGTLVDRALRYLDAGPAESPQITQDVLGIPQAPRVVAERLAVALLAGPLWNVSERAAVDLIEPTQYVTEVLS